MSISNLDPVLFYAGIGVLVFFTALALFAKGKSDDDE